MTVKDWKLVIDSDAPRVVHCWAENSVYDAEWDMERSDATCMLETGHVGPHEFTPDAEIIVRFAP